MRSLTVALGLTIAVAASGYALAAQPLTRADCAKAGMAWNDGTNVCGAGAAVTAAPAAAAPAMKEATGEPKKKMVKKVTKGHVTKKHVHYKSAKHPAPAAKKQKGGFFKWLSGKNKKS